MEKSVLVVVKFSFSASARDYGDNIGRVGHESATVFEGDDEFSGEQFLGENATLSGFGEYGGADGREFSAVFFVGIIFIAEAAFEPAAAA
jgi:hypothetical protein